MCASALTLIVVGVGCIAGLACPLHADSQRSTFSLRPVVDRSAHHSQRMHRVLINGAGSFARRYGSLGDAGAWSVGVGGGGIGTGGVWLGAVNGITTVVAIPLTSPMRGDVKRKTLPCSP